MEVRNCKQCGRLYNYIGGSYKSLCPSCIRALEGKFAEVKEYIEENSSATMVEISEACDVTTRQIEQWVREERLCFSDDSPIGIECESCGAMIKSGKYCNSCKSTMMNQLGSIYHKEPTPSMEAVRRKENGSRFLNMKTSDQVAQMRDSKNKN